MRGISGWTLVVSFVAACASGPARPAPERAEPAPTPPPPAAEAPAPAPVAAESGDHTVARNDVLDILDRGIPWFLRQIDTEPELDQGHFVGFRLTAFFANDTRFRSVDLVPGDVVLRVNGLPIERPEHAYRIWQELRVASEIRVEYLRAGQPRQIDYAIVDSNGG